MQETMTTKKESLKSSLMGKKSIQKKPVIEEDKAEQVTQEIHASHSRKEKPEATIKTSVDFRKSLYKAMKVKLIEHEMTMREYLESLIETDINK